MEIKNELGNTLSYIQSELYRIETMAGTLSSVEREHYIKLTNMDHRELVDLAVEEQNAARQLGTIKQMCLAMVQKVDEIKNSIRPDEIKESAERDKIH